MRLICPNCHSQTDTYTGKNPKYKNDHGQCVDCKQRVNKWVIKCHLCIKNDRIKEGFKALELLKQRKTMQEISCELNNMDYDCIRHRIFLATNKKVIDLRKEFNVPLNNSIKTSKPSKEELIELLKIKNKNQIAKEYKVSFNAVKNWMKKFNIV